MYETTHDLDEEVKCKCPKCEKIFIKKMLWSGGDVMPRMYCDDCVRVGYVPEGVGFHKYGFVKKSRRTSAAD